jgi:hypothetical protein
MLASLSSVANAAEITTYDDNGRKGIYIKGEIVASDLDSFKKVQQDCCSSAGNKVIVALNSLGGLVGVAAQIGEIVHTKGYVTVVENECQSACTLIWLSGKPRWVFKGSTVGFHSTRKNNDSPERSREGNDAVREYLDYLGISVKASNWMLSADPESMNYLNKDIAQKLNIEYSEIEPATTTTTIAETVPLTFQGTWCSDDKESTEPGPSNAYNTYAFTLSKKTSCKESLTVHGNSLNTKEGDCSITNIQKLSEDVYRIVVCGFVSGTAQIEKGQLVFRVTNELENIKTTETETPKTETPNPKTEAPKPTTVSNPTPNDTDLLPSTFVGSWCRIDAKKQIYIQHGNCVNEGRLGILKDIIYNNPVQPKHDEKCYIKGVHQTTPNTYIAHDSCGDATKLVLEDNTLTLSRV